MREIRLSGSEGGGTLVLPTPIYKTEFFRSLCRPHGGKSLVLSQSAAAPTV
jgi:hypothetical protein